MKKVNGTKVKERAPLVVTIGGVDVRIRSNPAKGKIPMEVWERAVAAVAATRKK